jgi:hypothetical protein
MPTDGQKTRSFTHTNLYKIKICGPYGSIIEPYLASIAGVV